MVKQASFPMLISRRTGYGIAFTDRQKILGVLYDNIKDRSGPGAALLVLAILLTR